MSSTAGPPRRHGRPILVLLLACVAASGAAPPGPSDLELMVRAKAALAADPGLKDLTLVVSIVDRVAVVGGPVPSDAAAARVAEVLRGVPGLADVRVSCWVPVADDPLRKLVADRVGPRPAAALPRPPAAVAADPRPAAVVVAQRATPLLGALLLDPAVPKSRRPPGVVTPPAPAGVPEFPTIPAPAVPVEPAADLAAAVEAVRAADPRFAGLTVAVRGDVVLIAGRAADGYAWELAAAVRRVPGVGRVVLGRIDER